MPVEHENAWTGMLDDAARRAGVARINTHFYIGDTVTFEWIDNRGNTIRTEERPHEWQQIADITPFEETTYAFDTNGIGLIDITDDIVNRYNTHTISADRELPWLDQMTINTDDIHIHGEWNGGDEEHPDIKEERGGALDEFLEEFKPQQTIPERSDKQE